MKVEKIPPGAPHKKQDLLEWLEWGIRELSFLGEGEAREECEQALEVVFGISRSELYLGGITPRVPLSNFSEWVQARKDRIPSAYLLGQTLFWDETLETEPGVFIPRPETEILIEAFLKTSGFSRESAFQFMDWGTGSGNIAVTVARLFPKAKGVAVDLSERALKLARRNAEKKGVGQRLHWIRADGLSAFRPATTFDVIVSNPPYIASGDWEGLQPEVRLEPRTALDGGKEGLDFYRRIFNEVARLKPGGSLWFEIGWGQKEAVQRFFELNRFKAIRSFKDLNQIDRVMRGVKGDG